MHCFFTTEPVRSSYCMPMWSHACTFSNPKNVYVSILVFSFLFQSLFPTVHVHLELYLCQQILGFSTPCWALKSTVPLLGVAAPLGESAFITHTKPVAGEIGWQLHTTVYLYISPVLTFVLELEEWCYGDAVTLVGSQFSRMESGCSFPRQGHLDLHVHFSPCPPGAMWSDCTSTLQPTSTQPCFLYAWISIKQRDGYSPMHPLWRRSLPTRQTKPHCFCSVLAQMKGCQSAASERYSSMAGKVRFMGQTKIDTLMVFHFHSFNIRSLGIVYIQHPVAVTRGHLIHIDDFEVGGGSQHLKHLI